MRAIPDCKEKSRYFGSSMMSFRLAAMELGLQKQQQQNNQQRVAIDSEREGERERESEPQNGKYGEYV
jgi:hypothetical protein